MKIYTKQDNFTLYEGNMLDMLSEIEENSIDSIVTDPPYELNFMGKTWDKSGIAFQKETWEKCLSVLKPGGYLVAFGGSRTFHRIACAIEDAGFEIREIISWIYGSGMPKSMNIGLAIDKRNGVDGEIIGYRNHQDFNAVGQYQNQISGINKRSFGQMSNVERIDTPIYKSTNEFDDWWTGLKPAYEPIIIARKPCEGSVDENQPTYEIKVPVKNVGGRAGGTTVQVYVRNLQDPDGPLKSLRAFQRTADIKPGETCHVSTELTRKSFEFWDSESNTMRVKSGKYELLIGTSSRAEDLKTVEISL
jgi:hypothetical protein